MNSVGKRAPHSHWWQVTSGYWESSVVLQVNLWGGCIGIVRP